MHLLKHCDIWFAEDDQALCNLEVSMPKLFPARATSMLACICFCALFSFPVFADVIIGNDARAIAMGGAGLAANNSTTLNPATLAERGMRFGIQWPSIYARMYGADLSDAISLLGDSSIDGDEAVKMARALGSTETEVSASVKAGLLLPKADLQVQATLHTHILPNESFKTWVAGGGNGTAPEDAEADVYAGGLTYLPSVGLGVYVPMNKDFGRLAIGVRVKPTTAYYSHFIIDSEALESGNARRAEEMGDADYLKQTSISADAGLLYRPAHMPKVRLALVVNNLIEPEEVTLDDNAPRDLYNLQLLPRSINVGAAYLDTRYTLAADFVDLTGAYGDMQLRLGSEFRIPGTNVSLRGGYNSSYGFAAGIGLGGFGIAVSKKSPLLLTHSIYF